MSFLNPLFLFGLGAALLPVLFHLVRKIRAKKVPFSSLMFLKATSKELVKKRRLRDLLLLAARAAIFALLALVFARPFFTQESLPFLPSRADQSVVLLLDRSYSMQYGDLFDQVRQAALDRIAEGAADDEFAVIAFADEAQVLTPLTRDRALLQNVIDGALQESNRPTDFYQPLRLAEEVLQDAQNEDRVLVLVSDFQQNGWAGSLENWQLGEGVAFEPVKVAPEAPGNAYVEAFNLAKQRVGSRVALRFDARAAALGLGEGARTARLVIDGAPAGEQELAPASTGQATFQLMAPREGAYQGTFVVDSGDDLPLDDQYYFTYTVAARPSLLIIDEGAGRTRDAFFLRNAFDMGEASLYRVDVGGRQRLRRGELQQHQVVFLANVPELTASQLEQLQAFVEGGGSLVVSFGDRVRLPAFSSHLEALGLGRVGEKVQVRSRQPGDAVIGEVDLRHPVFEAFAASGTSAILRPRFRQYVAVEPDTNAVVIGRYDTGEPFLVERRLGQGRVLVYTSTFNTAWTDFPINEMYVPFLYQLAQHATREDGQRYQYTVGEPVPIRGAAGEEWEVRAPDGSLYRVALDAFGTGFFRETEAPGNYAAARGADQYFFSVNVDPRESVLASRDQEEAYAAVVGTAPGAEPAAAAQQAALTPEEEEGRQKLWRYLLLAVLVLFAFETYYANRRTAVRRV